MITRDDALRFFEENKVRFTGINGGVYIDQEDFEKLAESLPSEPDQQDPRLFVAENEKEMKRLYDWIMDENRKGATTFFTSGWLRNVAKEIEFRIASRPSIDIVDKLRKQNPFNNPAYNDMYKQGYLNACYKLSELLNQSK